MLILIGLGIVFVSVVGGFLMEKGQLLVLLQPAEVIIIVGATAGAMVIANPLSLLTQVLKDVGRVLSGSRFTRDSYLESLQMLSEIFMFARKSGMAKLEADIEHPEQSSLLSRYPALMKDHHLLHFICDTIRTAAADVVPAHDLDAMVEHDIETHHHQISAPARSLATIADALPGLGIVAAVLGIVDTMGSLGGPTELIGEKVAAALVGTFLGVLLSYGVVAPLAANLEKDTEAETQFYHSIRAGLLAFARGLGPMMSVEFARRAIPSGLRPTFHEMEAACKSGAVRDQAAA
jgi:chemotaxis protein MotA